MVFFGLACFWFVLDSRSLELFGSVLSIFLTCSALFGRLFWMNQYGGGAGRAKCVKFRSCSRWLLVPTPKYLRPAISSFGVIKSFATGFGSKNQFLEKPLSSIFHENLNARS